MKALRKNLLAIAVVAGLGLSAVAIASPWGGHGPMGGGCPMMSGGGDGPMMGGQRGGGPGTRHAMMQQYHAERMELLAARLKLQPAQEAAWKGFLAAQDAHHEAKFKAMREMRRDRDETALEHFQERTQFMEQSLADMKALTQAASDLYAALDPTQKQVMDKFFTERPAWQGRGPGRGQGRGPAANPVNPAQPADAADAPAPADDSDE
ncbi:MAG TPA: Spy/CpxP family protein refolding chaperone [Candidatus Competibacteraceae bacterium]|nr:Spy/CpxP family protein refolding chaperone [Candidatus Competibacteraceae bacterium]HRZ05096.1 Spy/CpxP family protein refolding chaperone [Candidatus Competibacteraceae bacterium]HSA47558.1 Spy/CpxP family protein refolding chaperone [Candidatus Competibacteraceae bacterium]